MIGKVYTEFNRHMPSTEMCGVRHETYRFRNTNFSLKTLEGEIMDYFIKFEVYRKVMKDFSTRKPYNDRETNTKLLFDYIRSQKS